VDYIERDFDQQLARTQWNETEWKDKRDDNANKRLQLFNNRTYGVDLVEIGEEDFSSIVLPAHAHQYVNCAHETTLQKLVDRFETKLPDSTINDTCQDRISHILNYFDSNYANSTFLQGKFMFITKNLELSVNDNYTKTGYYTGSFHQFAAYAIWIVNNTFRPLRLYLIS
jgi:hypothetical protein